VKRRAALSETGKAAPQKSLATRYSKDAGQV